MVYILGHRPDEFGLVPDRDGFLTVKEILQALHEEEGWGYVRESHIREILMGKDRHHFEAVERGIRAVERRWKGDLTTPAASLPKLIYIPVRRKAHPVVMEKGLSPPPDKYLVLSPDAEVARRMGRRRDPRPVILEITAEAAARERVPFFAFETLFLSPHVPARFIAGPPVSKEIMESLREAETRKQPPPQPKPEAFTPGSFFLDMEKGPDGARRAKGKKRKSWKEDARKMRKRKT